VINPIPSSPHFMQQILVFFLHKIEKSWIQKNIDIKSISDNLEKTKVRALHK